MNATKQELLSFSTATHNPLFWTTIRQGCSLNLFKHVAHLINRGSAAWRPYFSNATSVAHAQTEINFS